jgi:hypothetical protein
MGDERFGDLGLGKVLSDYIKSEAQNDKVLFSDKCLPLEIVDEGTTYMVTTTFPFKQFLPSFSQPTNFQNDQQSGDVDLKVKVVNTLLRPVFIEKNVFLSTDIKHDRNGGQILNDLVQYLAMIIDNGIEFDCLSEMMQDACTPMVVDEMFGIVNHRKFSMVEFVAFVETFVRLNKSVDPDTIVFPASIPLITKLPAFNTFKTKGYVRENEPYKGIDPLTHRVVVRQKFYARWKDEGGLGLWFYDIDKDIFVHLNHKDLYLTSKGPPSDDFNGNYTIYNLAKEDPSKSIYKRLLNEIRIHVDQKPLNNFDLNDLSKYLDKRKVKSNNYDIYFFIKKDKTHDFVDLLRPFDEFANWFTDLMHPNFKKRDFKFIPSYKSEFVIAATFASFSFWYYIQLRYTKDVNIITQFQSKRAKIELDEHDFGVKDESVVKPTEPGKIWHALHKLAEFFVHENVTYFEFAILYTIIRVTKLDDLKYAGFYPQDFVILQPRIVFDMNDCIALKSGRTTGKVVMCGQPELSTQVNGRTKAQYLSLRCKFKTVISNPDAVTPVKNIKFSKYHYGGGSIVAKNIEDFIGEGEDNNKKSLLIIPQEYHEDKKDFYEVFSYRHYDPTVDKPVDYPNGFQVNWSTLKKRWSHVVSSRSLLQDDFNMISAQKVYNGRQAHFRKMDYDQVENLINK